MRIFCLIIVAASSLLLSGCKKEVGFEAHLLEAIEINTSRADTYAALSQDRSRKLSNALILSERLLLLTARVFDMRGLPFNKEGIGIVENDFVPMDLEHSAADPVYPANPYNDDTIEFINQIIDSFKQLEKDASFIQIAELSVNVLHSIENYEEIHNLHIPMLKHTVESIGFAAINAVAYSCESEKSTDKLAKDLINLQIFGLGPLVIFFDEEANKFHQEGIGILVHDLPKIPTIERYDEVAGAPPC